MKLTVCNKQNRVFCAEDYLQIPALSECWDMLDNKNNISMFSRINFEQGFISFDIWTPELISPMVADDKTSLVILNQNFDCHLPAHNSWEAIAKQVPNDCQNSWCCHLMETLPVFPAFFWGESTSYQWIPFTKPSNAGLWGFVCHEPEEAVEQ